MPSTSPDGFPYPTLASAADVPLDIKALADAAQAKAVTTDAAIAAALAKVPIRYDEPTQTGSGSLAANTTATVATINVTDPGVSYRVKVWATVVTTTPVVGIPADIQCTVGSTVWDTNRIGTSHAGIGYVVGIDTIISMLPRWSGILTGAQTVRLLMRARSNAITVGTADYCYGVEVWPV